jgi:hypothetical protein
MTHGSRDLLDGQEGGHSTDRRELHIENEVVLWINDRKCSNVKRETVSVGGDSKRVLLFNE